MDEFIFNESFDKTFVQMNDLGNSNEHYVSSHKFNLFQQFFIIGLEPKLIYNINKIDLKSLPSKFLEPSVISKYPNIALPYLCIPDKIVSSHCFPKGFVDIITKEENGLKMKDGNFIFSLDNPGYEEKDNSLRTKKLYYTCYYFYESIEDYNIFIKLRETSKNENNLFNQNYFIKKIICISSFLPLYKEAVKILRYLKKYIEYYSLKNMNGKIEIMKNNFIPIEKIIEGLIFNIPSLPRTKYEIHMSNETFSFDNNDNDKEKNRKEIIFKSLPVNKLPKSKIDISNLMNFFNLEEILEIIKWIILEVPILFFCENINDLTYTIEGIISLIYPFEYPYPVISILPEENYSMISIMKHFIFGINYKFSKDLLKKKGINIQNLNMLVIVKIEKRFNDNLNFKEREKMNINNPIIIYNSDKNKPILKLNQINSYYTGNNKEKIEESKIQNISLPSNQKEKAKKKFFERIEYKFSNIKKLSNKKEYNKIVCDELYETIFNFFLSVLLHYQEFCFKLKKKENKNERVKEIFMINKIYEKDDIIEGKYIENKLDINDIFKINDFMNTIPQNDKLFYSFFLNTRLFFDFMKKKIFPNSLLDKLEILFFDEKLNEKQAEILNNKQFTSPFLKHDYNELKGTLFLSNFKKATTPNFTEFLLSKQNQKRGYNYFQYITEANIDKENNNNNIDDENKNQISFNYLVFPKLLNDDIFYKEEFTIEKFWDPERSAFTSSNSNCIYNQFEKQNQLILNQTDIIKKYDEYNYSLDILSLFTYKIKDTIYLLWLQYFAKTYQYTKLSERKSEFRKMLNILKTAKIVDQNTLNILFWSIYKYGDNSMIQSLFFYIKNKSYVTYLILREKSKEQNNFIKFNFKKEENEEIKNEEKRTKNKISFCDISYCENKSCNKSYNIQNKFNINESISNKINMFKFKCEKCKKEQSIQITSIYNKGDGDFININFKLISPMALIKRKWFQDKLELNLYDIIKEHIDPYMSAIFYFHLLDIYYDFLFPPKTNFVHLEKLNNCTFSLKKEISQEPVKIIYSNINKENRKIYKFEKIGENKEFLGDIKEEDRTVTKSVSQNYLKTLNKKNIKEKKKKKETNDYSLDLITEDLDISDNTKGIFEFKNNSKKKIIKHDKAQIKNKISKESNEKPITNKNITELQQKTQNSFEFFKNIKKKKK